MTLGRRNVFAALVLALPATILVFMAIGRLDTRDRIAQLERIAQSFLTEVMRDACESDAQWFLAGPRAGRPRPEDRLQPDADVRLPRPSAAQMPFEYFAFDEEFVPRSVAGPRFPADFRNAMRTSPPTRMISAEYDSALGPGIETAIMTGWGPGPCSILLFRQPGPPHRRATAIGLFAGTYVVFATVAWLAALPTALRIRKLSKQAKDSTRQDYAGFVEVSGRDEISSMGAVFNETAADIRRKAADARDREEALRRYVENVTEEVAAPLAELERQLASLQAAGGGVDLVQSVREAHRLRMQLLNQAAVTRLRGVNDSSPREDVDLAAVVAKLVAGRGELAAVCQVTLDGSKATTPLTIKADPALIEQAIANVIDNGIFYNRAGGTVRVELASYDHGQRFRLLVADTGPGVTDDEFAGLTANRRFRGDESRIRRPGGRGLGLALAREVADRFGLQLDLRRPSTGGLEAEFSTRA